MIIVITVQERNRRTGKIETIVSHGVDSVTLRNVILENTTPENLGAKYDPEIGGYVLKD